MKATKIIKDILAANSGVTDIVSTRIYQMRVPDNGSFPCLQYQQISTVPINQKSGAAGGDFARVQVNCYSSKSYKESSDLADAVRAALEAYSGTTTNGHVVQYVEFLSAFDTIDDTAQYSGVFSTVMDFMIHYNNG